MKLIHDTQQEEYLMINLPNYVVDNKIERYEDLKATSGLKLTLWQFLVAEEYEDMNPDNIDTVKPTEVRRV